MTFQPGERIVIRDCGLPEYEGTCGKVMSRSRERQCWDVLFDNGDKMPVWEDYIVPVLQDAFNSLVNEA